MAVWFDMAGYDSDFFCDDCVPRGCSCNVEPIDGDIFNLNPVNWRQNKDSLGRLLPCCEFSYSEDGFDAHI